MIAGEGLQQFADFDDLLGVETAGGLVEDQDVGVVDDGLGDADALAVAFGQLADQLGADVAEGAAPDDLVGAALDVGAGDALELADEGEVLDDLHLGVEGRGFGEVADALLDLLRVLQHVEAGDGGLAGGGREEAGEDAHRGGFPGAVGAEEADDLALFHLEGDVVYGDSTCVSLG